MKRLLPYAILVVLILLLSGCSPNPPELKVYSGNTNVPTVLGSYCWKSLVSKLCVDMIPPDDLLKEKGYTPPVVPPGSTLRLTFTVSPDPGSVVISQPPEKPLISDGTLSIPKEPGIYTYSVSAQWEGKGSAVYFFQVQVK